MNGVSGVKILVQAMATTEFWAGMAFILVSVEDVLLATGQRQKRSMTETDARPQFSVFAGLVIESHFDIFPDDDDGD